MRRTNFSEMPCPIARGLDRVGEWWSILILRDASQGLTRFDQFQKSLGIAPNMLSRRLDDLVEAGLLQRRPYQARPPRDEYLLTETGRDFQPVLVAMMAWGNRHFTPEGISSQLVEVATGRPVEPVVVDRVTGLPVSDPAFRYAAGPAANDVVRARIAFMDSKREETHG